MDDTDFMFFLLIVILIILTISNSIIVVNSKNFEGISVNVLDQTCKKLMNSTTAKFHQQKGLQRDFSCWDGEETLMIVEDPFNIKRIKS